MNSQLKLFNFKTPLSRHCLDWYQ